MAKALNVSRIVRLVVCTRLPITSTIACESGETHPGFKTKVSAAANVQRVKSMFVTEILPSSLARITGLKVGDEILELKVHKVHGDPIEDLWHEKHSIRSEDTIRLGIRHANGISENIRFPTSRALSA